LESIAAHGDSGSWIIEKDSGKLCGHIVAGDPSTGLAYIIPARVVFEEIEIMTIDSLLPPLPEDMSERMSQLQVSPSTIEGVPKETERNAQPSSVRPSTSP